MSFAVSYSDGRINKLVKVTASFIYSAGHFSRAISVVLYFNVGFMNSLVQRCQNSDIFANAVGHASMYLSSSFMLEHFKLQSHAEKSSHNTNRTNRQRPETLCAPSLPQMLPVMVYIWFQRATLLPLITPQYVHGDCMQTLSAFWEEPKSPESRLSRDYLRALDPAEHRGDGLVVTDAHGQRLFS